MNVPSDLCRLRRHDRFATLIADLAKDIRRTAREAFATPAGTSRPVRYLSALLTFSMMAVLLYRLSHTLYAKGWRRAATTLGLVNAIFHKVTITPSSCIGGGLYLPHPPAILFHGTAGEDLTLYSGVVCTSLGPSASTPVERAPCLGDRVSVGVHGAVLGPVRVGDDTRIGFSVVLTEDAPNDTIVASRRMRARVKRR